jgi:hypothetical protein
MHAANIKNATQTLPRPLQQPCTRSVAYGTDPKGSEASENENGFEKKSSLASEEKGLAENAAELSFFFSSPPVAQ